MSLWDTRNTSLAALEGSLRAEAQILQETFDLLDECIKQIGAVDIKTAYSRVCTLILIKARNLAVSCYSLTLDGLAQEAGALLRPLIEALELLEYLRQDSSRVDEVIENRLPKAGEIAKRIQGKFKNLRDYLNDNSSHFGFTFESVRHLVDWNTFELKVVQPYHQKVLNENLSTLFAVLIMLTIEAANSLFVVGNSKADEITDEIDDCKNRGLLLFYELPKLQE